MFDKTKEPVAGAFRKLSGHFQRPAERLLSHCQVEGKGLLRVRQGAV